MQQGGAKSPRRRELDPDSVSEGAEYVIMARRDAVELLLREDDRGIRVGLP